MGIIDAWLQMVGPVHPHPQPEHTIKIIMQNGFFHQWTTIDEPISDQYSEPTINRRLW